MINSEDFGLVLPSNINSQTIEKFLDQRSSFVENRATFRFIIINVIDEYIFIHDTWRNKTVGINVGSYVSNLAFRWLKKYDIKLSVIPLYDEQLFENAVLDAVGLNYDNLMILMK